MPFTYRMLRNGTLMHTLAVGRCTFEAACHLRERIRNDETITEIYDNLVDLSRVEELVVSPDQLLQIREMIVADPKRIARRVAIVADTNSVWLTAKAWEEATETMGRSYIVFGDFDSACLWLSIDEEHRKQIADG